MQYGDPVIQRDYQNYKVSWYSFLDDFTKNNITRLNIGEMIMVHLLLNIQLKLLFHLHLINEYKNQITIYKAYLDI